MLGHRGPGVINMAPKRKETRSWTPSFEQTPERLFLGANRNKRDPERNAAAVPAPAGSTLSVRQNFGINQRR
jgi:hypothetical protein